MKFRNVIFDCDSTLVKIEGLDEIACRKGLNGRVQKITAACMNGDLPFSQSFRRRIQIVQPTTEDLIWLGRRYVEEVIEDARDVVSKLHRLGFRVYILTGGLYSAVRILARHLMVEEEYLCAIKLKGTVPFQGTVPMEADDLDTFKARFVQKIKKSGPTVLVGDGMTDYEAGKFADLFIGFGGVVFRPQLKKLCQFYIQEPRLQAVLDHVL